MSPTTSLEGQGHQFFADINYLLKAPIIEVVFVPPPKFMHFQPTQRKSCCKSPTQMKQDEMLTSPC